MLRNLPGNARAHLSLGNKFMRNLESRGSSSANDNLRTMAVLDVKQWAQFTTNSLIRD